jgi:hypothetical protein
VLAVASSSQGVHPGGSGHWGVVGGGRMVRGPLLDEEDESDDMLLLEDDEGVAELEDDDEGGTEPEDEDEDIMVYGFGGKVVSEKKLKPVKD